MKWAEVTSTQDYLSADEGTREAMRNLYFDEVIATQVDARIRDDVRREFDVDTLLNPIRGKMRELNPQADEQDIEYLTRNKIKELRKQQLTPEEAYDLRVENYQQAGSSRTQAEQAAGFDIGLEQKFQQKHPSIMTPVRGDIGAISSEENEAWREKYGEDEIIRRRAEEYPFLAGMARSTLQLGTGAVGAAQVPFAWFGKEAPEALTNIGISLDDAARKLTPRYLEDPLNAKNTADQIAYALGAGMFWSAGSLGAILNPAFSAAYLGTAGVTSAGSSYIENKRAGIPEIEAQVNAGLKGLFETGTERTGIELGRYAMKAWGSLPQNMRQAVAARMIGFTGIGGAMTAQEGGEEYFNQMAGNLADKITGMVMEKSGRGDQATARSLSERSLFDGVNQAFFQGAVGGAPLGIGLGGIAVSQPSTPQQGLLNRQTEILRQAAIDERKQLDADQAMQNLGQAQSAEEAIDQFMKATDVPLQMPDIQMPEAAPIQGIPSETGVITQGIAPSQEIAEQPIQTEAILQPQAQPTDFDVSTRNDTQLAYLAEHGQPGWKEAAIAEANRRQTNVSHTDSAPAVVATPDTSQVNVAPGSVPTPDVLGRSELSGGRQADSSATPSPGRRKLVPVGNGVQPQATLIRKSDGTPFSKASGAALAMSAKKLAETHQVVPYQGGYAIVPKETQNAGQEQVRVSGEVEEGQELVQAMPEREGGQEAISTSRNVQEPGQEEGAAEPVVPKRLVPIAKEQQKAKKLTPVTTPATPLPESVPAPVTSKGDFGTLTDAAKEELTGEAKSLVVAAVAYGQDNADAAFAKARKQKMWLSHEADFVASEFRRILDERNNRTQPTGAALATQPEQVDQTEGQAQGTEGKTAGVTKRDGYEIKPIKVRVDGVVEERWNLQSEDNRVRAANGEREIGGDSLHKSRDEAIAEAYKQAARAEKDRKSAAEAKARNDATPSTTAPAEAPAQPEPVKAEAEKAKAPKPQGKLDLGKDGIDGEEIVFARVPNGNEAFQYALGRTTEDGDVAVFRRRADERGSYGGWRWETDAGKLDTVSKNVAVQDTEEPAVPAEAKLEEPQHIEDSKAEFITPEIIRESIAANAESTPRNMKEAREWLVNRIDTAIEKAPKRSDKINRITVTKLGSVELAYEPLYAAYEKARTLKVLSDKREAMNTLSKAIDNKPKTVGEFLGYVKFDVPGDGTFKVLDSKETLERFKSRVLKATGVFKASDKIGTPEKSSLASEMEKARNPKVAKSAATPAAPIAETGEKAQPKQTEAKSKTRLSRAERGTGRGIPTRDAQAIVNIYREVNRNAPQIHILDHPLGLEGMGDSARVLLDEIERRGAMNDVRGAFHEGDIYIFTTHLRDQADVVRLLTHEGRHFALRAMRGPALDKILTDIYRTNRTVREAAGTQSRLLDIKSQVEATEEVLADMSTEQLTKLKGWDRLVAYIRTKMRALIAALRRHRFNEIADSLEATVKNWTDADVAYLVQRADKFVRYGEGGVTEGTAFGERLSRAGQDSRKQDALGALNGDPRATTADSLPQETKPDSARRVAQDAMLRFKRLQQWLKDQGVDISESANVYQRENLGKAQTANEIEDFREFVEKPYIKKVADAGFDLGDIEDYIEAVHIPEANARMAMIHNDPEATANGVATERANEIIAEFETMENFDEFKELADEMRAIGEETLEMKLREGLISQKMYGAYKATYSHWVPIRGDMANKTGYGKGMSTNARQKRRFGHEARDERIFENLIQDRERTIFQLNHNKLGRVVANFLLEAQNPDIGTVDRPPKHGVMKDFSYAVSHNGRFIASFETQSEAKTFIVRTLATKTKAIQEMELSAQQFDVTKSYDPHVVMMARPLLEDNEIQFYVKGEPIRIQLNDPLTARAATNAGIEHLAGMFYVAQQFNRFLSKAYTAWSPDFLIVNPIRDIYQGAVVLTGKEGHQFAGKVAKQYPFAFKELWKAHKDSRTSDWVTRYRKAGGNTGAAYLSDLDRVGTSAINAYHEYIGARNTYEKVYEDAIEAGDSQTKARAKAAFKAGVAGFEEIPVLGHFLKVMERLNGVFENTLRLATFKAGIESGMSDQQAAQLAKDLMNFNRKGEITSQMGALYLFFNPGVQGAHIVLESLTTAPHKNEARFLIGGLTMLAFLLAEMARNGDDNDELKWSNIPDYVKARNLVVKVGDVEVTIPVAYGFGIFHMIGHALSDMIHGVPSAKIALQLADGMFENFSVFGNPLVEKDGKVEFHPEQLTPTAVKMVTAPASNLDSMGRPIQPRKYKTSSPDSQNMTRSMRGSGYAKTAAVMNEWTGGSKYESGYIDVSPNVLQYWVRSLTGGTGRFAGDVWDAAMGGMKGVAPDLERVPVVRKLVRVSDVDESRSAFWHAAGKARMAAEQYRAAVRDRNHEKAREMREENKSLIKLASFADRTIEMATARRNAVDKVNASDIPLSEQRKKIKELERREQEVYDAFLKAYDAKVK